MVTMLTRALVVCIFALVLCANASLFSEVSKEQLFLIQRREKFAPADANAADRVTRALPSPAMLSDEAIASMRPRQLHQLLADRQIECHGCIEQSELAQKAIEVYRLPTTDQRVAMMLTATDNTPLSQQQDNANRVFFAEVAHRKKCDLLFNNSAICNDAAA